ncbi:hypothetical protein AB0A67_01195, partial [Streptomyces eurythermus]
MSGQLGARLDAHRGHGLGLAQLVPGVLEQGTSGISAVRPASSVAPAGLPVRERDERPSKALE